MNKIIKKMIDEGWCDLCSKNVADCIKAGKCFGEEKYEKEKKKNAEKKSV